MKRLLFTIAISLPLPIICHPIFAQAKLVMNGGVINITNGASLVIANPDNTAITYNSGYIQSEGASNKVIWAIGSGTGGYYIIPFGNASGYMPLSFTATGGTTDGYYIFSTYGTPTWKNSDDLPPGVTNVDAQGLDNSSKLTDRFWQISPQDYTTKPELTNLSFSYSDAENAAPNTITESKLIAQRWNNVAMTWSDFIPSSTVNTVNNTVIVASIEGAHLYDWWTLIDAGSPLPVILVDFHATAVNHVVKTNWQTNSETNTAIFEIFRSKDGDHFDKAGQVAAAGNSLALLQYVFEDDQPFSGTSYYRLKVMDLDGNYTWSNIAKVVLGDDMLIHLYPNPAIDFITLHMDNSIVISAAVASVYDSKGSLVQSLRITQANQQISISRLPPGSYRLVIKTNNGIHTLPFIKK